MPKNEQDRRVQRTRELLHRAIIELMTEKGYDAITVSDITDRANLGRTTFYMHYRSKADLLLSGHQESFFKIAFDTMTRDDILAAEAPSQLVAIFEQALQVRGMYLTIMQGADVYSLMRGIREQFARSLETRLRIWFNEKDSSIPFGILANYVAGSQLSLMSWWLESRSVFSPQQMARAFHQLRRAALRDALHLG